MKALLDTNVLLWWLNDDARLRPFAATIADPTNEVLFSSVSTVEIAIKVSLGKLTVPRAYVDSLLRDDIRELEFTARHGQAVEPLPWYHRDPFDRMIIAQALTEGLPVLTADRVFHRYGVQVIPVEWRPSGVG